MENSGLDPAQFVPLVVPVSCNAYLIKNSGADTFYMRSTKDDPDTEDQLGSGGCEALVIGSQLPGSDHPRYKSGHVLYYVKCTGPIVGKFWM
jgi:hypothetical protein